MLPISSKMAAICCTMGLTAVGHTAEAVGGGVLIPEGNREGTEEAEVQSFVVPVANGIQLETRRRTRHQPTHAAQDVSS